MSLMGLFGLLVKMETLLLQRSYSSEDLSFSPKSDRLYHAILPGVFGCRYGKKYQCLKLCRIYMHQTESLSGHVGIEAQLRRKKGKAARASLKNPHTSGRKGQARVVDKFRKQHPEREVTRREIFIKTHYRKDGTPSSHHADMQWSAAYITMKGTGIRLAKVGFAVYGIDYLGHGKSSVLQDVGPACAEEECAAEAVGPHVEWQPDDVM